MQHKLRGACGDDPALVGRRRHGQQVAGEDRQDREGQVERTQSVDSAGSMLKEYTIQEKCCYQLRCSVCVCVCFMKATPVGS